MNILKPITLTLGLFAWTGSGSVQTIIEGSEPAGQYRIDSFEDYQGATELEEKSIGWLGRLGSDEITAPIVITTHTAIVSPSSQGLRLFAVHVSTPQRTAWLYWEFCAETGSFSEVRAVLE